MTVWLLALVLLASLAALGYRQGALRVAFSFAGIVAGVWLAGPFAGLARKVLTVVGVRNPALLWLLAPFIVYLVILCIFKIIGYNVHEKLVSHYQLRSTDLRSAMWPRLNMRLGLCLGLVNATAYLVLISWVIFVLGYWTVQLAIPGEDSRSMQLLNRLASDLQSTGMSRVVRAIDPMPEAFYQAADVAGLVFHHPLLEARLSRYPALLSLSEQPYFQALGQDVAFAELRLKQEPISKVLAYPAVETIFKDPDALDLIWRVTKPDLEDLNTCLETGTSPKYDSERVLGRWAFQVNGALAAYRAAKPDLTAIEMQNIRKWMTTAFATTTLVAAADHTAWLKNTPLINTPTAAKSANELFTVQGQWEDTGGNCRFTFQRAGKTEEISAQIEGDRLTLLRDGLTLVFNRVN